MRNLLLFACLLLSAAGPTRAERPAGPPGDPGRQASAAPGPRQGGGARLATPAVADANPYRTPEDAAIGKRLFEGRCGQCHGQTGEGGRGAVLNTGRFRHGGSDRELFVTIRNGIPNSEMPAAPSLPVRDVWRLVGHVQQLGLRGAQEAVPGNAASGAAIYAKSGCAACHRIGSQGAFVGPDLTDIGSRRAARYLRESIVRPDADIPLDYRTVAVVDRRGARTTGIHLNEDEYSIHLRDLGGALHSFMKADLAEVSLPRTSLMPPFVALAGDALDDLVAYLASLGQERTAASAGPGPAPAQAASMSEEWRFDRLDAIGGHKTTILGHPVVIDTPIGKAVQFDGVDAALDIDAHPLAGAETFTFEAIFRPDGGPREQRWFHLSERDPATGLDTDNRMLFEIRVEGDAWFLDSYNQSGAESKALMNKAALHPLGRWYHVASVYDGREFRNYVDGTLEGAAEIRLAPHGAGHASVGMRINRVFYFKGAVARARFTRKALSPAEFLPPPAAGVPAR